MKKKLGFSLQKPIMLLILVAALSIRLPGIFLTVNNLLNILLAVCIWGIMVCGTSFALLNGGIDLCIGSTAALAGCTMVLITIAFGYSTAGTILGIVCGLGLGVLCGLFNGCISYYFALPAFVVSLAAKNIVLGIAQRITNQGTIICMHSDLMNFIGTGKVLGVPFLVVFFLIIFALAWFVQNRTTFGKHVYAVGGNPLASRYSGLNSRRIGISTYVISGFTAALSVIMLSCFNRQAVATQAGSYDGNVLVALVVGGISLQGGEGSLAGAMFGLLLLGIINNAMVLLGIDSTYQDLIQGVLVMIAVAVDVYARNKNNGLKRRRPLWKKKNA